MFIRVKCTDPFRRSGDVEYILGARMRRLKKRGWELEWHDIRQYLEALSEIEVSQGEQHYLLRTPLQGVAGKVLQAAGAAIPSAVRPVG